MRHATRPILFAATLWAACGCQHTEETTPTGRITNPNVTYPANYHAVEGTPAVTAKAHFAAGQVAESQYNLDKAAEQYRAAVKLDPMHQEALYRLGMILTAERKPDAVQVWQQYVHATGGTATAYSNLGYALELAGRAPEAEEAFQTGIGKDPQCEACRVNYAGLLARRGQWAAAADQLATVLRPAEVEFDLGSVSEQQGDTKAAAMRYRRALQLNPNFNAAKVRLAAVEMPAGQADSSR